VTGSSHARTVAIVPAYNSADRIGATVRALLDVESIDEVLVVDDGSTDSTASVALSAGVQVLHLATNRGKGGAVAAGMAKVGSPDIVVLVDADTAESATETRALIAPVVAGDADMTVAVLPSAGQRAGFGLVRDVAAEGIRQATGREFLAPLSGQRAIKASVLSGIELAPRFGLEVGLTIDVVAAGGRVVEVETEFDHEHTGRSIAGFRHRFGQGRDLVRALFERLGFVATVRLIVSALWKRVRR